MFCGTGDGILWNGHPSVVLYTETNSDEHLLLLRYFNRQKNNNLISGVLKCQVNIYIQEITSYWTEIEIINESSILNWGFKEHVIIFVSNKVITHSVKRRIRTEILILIKLYEHSTWLRVVN